MVTVDELRAEYERLAGVASTEQHRFAMSARPNGIRLAEAGRQANEARKKWMAAKLAVDTCQLT